MSRIRIGGRLTQGAKESGWQRLLSRNVLLSLSVSVALLDLTLGLLPYPPGLIGELTLPSTAFSTTLVGALTAVVLTAGRITIRSLAKARNAVSAGAEAVWAALCLGSIACFLTTQTFFPATSSALGFALALPAGVVSAVAAFFGVRALIGRFEALERARSLLLILPWLLGVTIAAQVFKRFNELHDWGVATEVWAVAWLTLLAALVAWSCVRPGSLTLARAPAVVAVALAAVGATAPFGGAKVRSAAEQDVAENHSKLGPIILLTIDTLRRDAVSFDENGPTPRLASLSHDSITFRRAYTTSPWTKPAMASMLTGLSPWVHQLGAINQGIPPSAPTLAEMLAAEGHQTAAIGSNRLLSIFESDGSFARGFRHYEVYPLQGARIPNVLGKRLASLALFQLMGLDVDTEQLTEAALGWLRRNTSGDFFLWLHYYDPHSPYAPPPQWTPAESPLTSFRVHNADPSDFSAERRKTVKALYDAETRFVDHQVGRVVDELETLGLYDEALLIVSSDHGEEFWDHGGLDHGHTLFDELLGVPLIVKLPWSRLTGVVERPVSTLRIAPTILDLAGVPYEPDAFSQTSLKPLMEGEDSLDRQPVFATALLTGPRLESVVVDDFKLICSPGCERGRAYDLRADPHEKTDLWDSTDSRRQRASRLLVEHRADSERLRRRHGVEGPRSFELREAEIEGLKSLGYIE